MRGRSSSDERHDLEAGHAPDAPLPHRPRADQRQRLRDVVAAGAHVRRAPDGERDRARPFALVLEIALGQQIGGATPEIQAAGVGTARTSTE